MSVLAKLRQAFNIIVGARNALIDKGETVEYDDDIPQIIEDMDTGGDLELVKTIIERPSDTDLVIPEGVTSIGNNVFYVFSGLKTVETPVSVGAISDDAFWGCPNLMYANIKSGRLMSMVFAQCSELTTVLLGQGVTYLFDRCFMNCTKLSTINIPASITRIYTGYQMFGNCSALENVTVGNGFNCNGLDLSPSTKYSAATIVSWLNALADRTGQTAYTLIIGSTNLAKLTSDQIAIATNKNWNLA